LQSQRQMSNNEANDAITRRFAAMNAVGSGAYQKALERQQNQFQELGAQTEMDVSGQESQARRALMEAEAQREFGSSEAQNQRAFAASEGKRASELGIAQYNNDLAFRQAMAKFDSNSKLRQLDLAGYQSELAANEQDFNKQLAQYTTKNQGGLLGAGGFLGTGLGKF